MKFRNAAPVAAMLVAASLAGCGQGQQQKAAQNLPAVTVAKPAQWTVVDLDEYVGRFVAVNSVDIRSRLSGYLLQIHFTDGQIVKKGDLLFTIDPIVLEQTRANLAQARANLAFAKADLQRGQSLVQNKTITEQVMTSSYKPRMSPRRPSPPRRRWCVRPNSTSTSTGNCARRSTARSATGACRSETS
jgi:multidrug efflux pump subunit AcrA (membrane-fusion protein)